MTPERVNPVGHSAAEILLMNAMTDAAPGAKFEAAFVTPDQAAANAEKRSILVDVVVTVNGVQVPFMKIVNEAWKQIEASIEAEVLVKAKELVGRSRLDKLADKLERVEWELEEALRAAQLKDAS